MRKKVRKILSILFLTGLIFSPLSPLVNLQNVYAKSTATQSIEICFLNLDHDGKPITVLPTGTTVSLDLYTDPGHLVEGKVNSYGTHFVTISQTHESANRNLINNDGIDDSYCVTKQFKNPTNSEYTYKPVTIKSDKNWLASRYNDQNNINLVDPDIAFPYSGEWFDSIPGNESKRNTNADGHLVMDSDRSVRRVFVVNQLDMNLPKYAVVFSNSITSTNEYTLSTIPAALAVDSSIDLRLGVQNIGSLNWLSANSAFQNPVNVSYHWQNLDNDALSIFDGNRALLNHNLSYTQSDTNIALRLNTPASPGNYRLVLDLVHEGVTWFSAKGASTWAMPIQIVPILTQYTAQSIPSLPAPVSKVLGSAITSLATNTYIVQSARPWDPSWHCGGYDCYIGIAEEVYHCSALGIPNTVPPNTTSESALTGMCWWPIFNANRALYQANPIPPVYQSQPWNYLEVGWQLVIPPLGGSTNPPTDPTVPTTSNFTGIPASSVTDPYAGMNGAYSAWPQVTFDRFIAWDGSYKVDQIKWSETQRPQAPTVTGLATNSTGTAVTVYGVAIPKNHPVNIRVWNEYRYCWACGSGWDFHYQQGTAQNVKVVLFKFGPGDSWQYLGEVWNDSPDGHWNITLPLGTNLKSGDRIFAEVQIEADYTFPALRWWNNTYESVNFNLRNPKYFGYPYFASGGSNALSVPNVLVDPRSEAEKAIDARANQMGSVGVSALTSVCGLPAKTYSQVIPGHSGMIVYTNSRAVYSYGGTLDTFNYFLDRCSRFGPPINDPYNGGLGPFITPGAYQDFANGRIYWSNKYLGKFVYGVISNKFEQAGGTNSTYGWPIDEVHPVTENSSTVNCQNFEGGRICDADFTPYTQAQNALKPILGHYPAIADISTFCGGMQKIAIPNGIAYYDPIYKNVRQITGAIYTAWAENCNLYGLPENDTTTVIGFGGIAGRFQRFNKNNQQFDFYQAGTGAAVILEGPVKNKYDSKGGVGRLGFPQTSYNQGLGAAGRCGGPGTFWNLGNGRIYQNGDLYHLVYGDTPIGNYFFAGGADTKFGLPKNDENTNGTYSWQDFDVTRLELTWPGGVSSTRSADSCPSASTPKPKDPECPIDEIWDGDKCVYKINEQLLMELVAVSINPTLMPGHYSLDSNLSQEALIKILTKAHELGISNKNYISFFFGNAQIESNMGYYMTELGGQTYFSAYDYILGNQGPPDGYNFRGRGYIQLTGRNNFTTFSSITGRDLLKNPDQAASDKDLAAYILVYGITKGTFIKNIHTIEYYNLGNNDFNFFEARDLVNGDKFNQDGQSGMQKGKFVELAAKNYLKILQKY